MPARLRPADPAEVEAALARLAAAATADDLRLLTKHFLALLEQRAPGPLRRGAGAAVRRGAGGPGVRHTRGTPPAVVETDPETWVALATGRLSWAEADAAGAISASGERADLSAYLPLEQGSLKPEG